MADRIIDSPGRQVSGDDGHSELDIVGSIPLRQHSATPMTSSLQQQQAPVPAPEPDVDGHTDQELIALIKYYRGSGRGLAGQSRMQLQVLLEYHEVIDERPMRVDFTDNPQEKTTSSDTSSLDKGATANDGVTDRRAREDDSVQEEQRKRGRLQVMELDD